MTKTPGQHAYEAELVTFPTYENGTARKAWEDLPDYAKQSWEKKPAPRKPIRRTGATAIQ